METMIYMNEENINQDLICESCKKPFFDPVSLPPCEQTFCRQCIQLNLEKHLNGCSECRNKNLTNQDFRTETRVLRKMLGRLLVKCALCQEENIQRSDFQQHSEQLCPKRIVSCRAKDIKCQWNGNYDQLDQHLNICPYQQIRNDLTQLIKDQNSLIVLQTVFQGLQNKFGQMKIENENLTKQIERIQLENKALTDLSNQQIKQIEKSKQDLNEINQLKEENQQLIQLKQIQTENENLNQQIKDLNIQNQSIQDQSEQYQIQINQLKTFLQNAVQSYQESHNLLNENLTFKQIIEEQKEQLNSLNEENQELKDQQSQFDVIEKQNLSLIEQIQIDNDQLHQKLIEDQLIIEKQDILIQQLKTKLNQTLIQSQEFSFNCEYENKQLKQLIDQFQSKSLIHLTNEQLNDNDMDILINYGLVSKKFHSILLWNNALTDRSLVKLFYSLNLNKTLTKLSIRNNSLSDLCLKFLFESLSFNNQTLKELILSSNQINDQGFIYLSDIFKSNKTIITFGLQENLITDKSMEYFAKIILSYENNLQNLSFYSNKSITDSSIQSLIDIIQNKKSLKTFWIWDCNLSKQGKDQIQNSVQFNNDFDLQLETNI